MMIKLMTYIAEIMLSGCVCSLSQNHPAIKASEREEGCLSKDGAWQQRLPSSHAVQTPAALLSPGVCGKTQFQDFSEFSKSEPASSQGPGAIHLYVKAENARISDEAQWVKVIAAKSDNQNSMTLPHMVEGENRPL